MIQEIVDFMRNQAHVLVVALALSCGIKAAMSWLVGTRRFVMRLT
jgi:hypothetical protein